MATISVVKLKVRRGPDSQRKLITLDNGELGFVTDPSAHRLFVGDGVAKGGISTTMKFFYGSITSPTSLIYTQVGDLVYNTDDTRLYILTGIDSQNFPDYSNRQAYQYIGTSIDDTTLRYYAGGKLGVKTTGISAIHVSTDVFDLTKGFGRSSSTSKVRVDLSTIDATVLPASNPGIGKLWSSGGYLVTGDITVGMVTTVTGIAPITVANGSTTPAISLGVVPSNLGGAGAVNGLLKANGAGTVTAAVAGTDYVIPSGSITGNAATATKLATARTINGVSFDGSTNITLPALSLAGDDGITITSTPTTTTIGIGVVPSTSGGAGSISGLLKANGAGTVTAAVAGTDYAAAGTAVPTGAVMYYPRTSAPTGWIECNGAAITAAMGASYTALRTLLLAGGSPFGVVGSDPKVPDLRGVFVRGSGTQVIGGNTYSGIHGTAQADAFESHTHTGTSGSAGDHTHTGSTSTAGSHTHTINEGSKSPVGGGLLTSGDDYTTIAYTSQTTSAGGDHSHTLSTSSGGAHTHTISIGAAGSTETRPANVALLACIKL